MVLNLPVPSIVIDYTLFVLGEYRMDIVGINIIDIL